MSNTATKSRVPQNLTSKQRASWKEGYVRGSDSALPEMFAQGLESELARRGFSSGVTGMLGAVTSKFSGTAVSKWGSQSFTETRTTIGAIARRPEVGYTLWGSEFIAGRRIYMQGVVAGLRDQGVTVVESGEDQSLNSAVADTIEKIPAEERSDSAVYSWRRKAA